MFASIPSELLLIAAGTVGGLLSGAYALMECLGREITAQRRHGSCYFMFAVGIVVSGPFALIFSKLVGDQVKLFAGPGQYAGAFTLGMIAMLAGPKIRDRALTALDKKGSRSDAEPPKQ